MRSDFNLSAAALKYRQLTLFFLIVIALGGVAAFFKLGQRGQCVFADHGRDLRAGRAIERTRAPGGVAATGGGWRNG